jgi:hypothetical protein
LNRKNRKATTIAFRFFYELQRIIIVVIFAEIHCFRFCRNPFAWIIAEFPAFTTDGDYALFYAQNLLFINFCAISAIGTGFFNSFAK